MSVLCPRKETSCDTVGMSARLVVLVAVLLSLCAAQQQPPMFSPWYSEALRDILDLEQADIVQLEQKLAANPEDFPTRLKLMAYHQRADRSARAEDLAKRLRHTFWLIEHHPESELLHSHVSHFSRHELTPTEYQRAVALWSAATNTRPNNATVAWNAASFFRELAPDLHLRYLEAAAAADPNHSFILRRLALVYANEIASDGPLASRAQAGLEASKNVWVLGNAAYILQSRYNHGLQAGAWNPRAAELAERYFLRAKALDPSLDRQAILPQLHPNQIEPKYRERMQRIQELQARAEDALGKIRRLPVDAFPELPPAVAGVLRARNCRVPQPWGDGQPTNVIRGEYFVKGETGWAVLCSVNQSTTLLVFRNDRDTNPDTINTSKDLHYLQTVSGDQMGYSRQIANADRAYIMRHYRAYGGPEPPAIDHDGIDDAFIEKGSVTWYFHKGKWMSLQGAD